MPKPDRTEKGPWTVEWDGRDVYISSDDFNHDVCLIVRGDLGDIEGPYRREYARKLCDVLNAAMPITF